MPEKVPEIGILEWCRSGEYGQVEQLLEDLKKMGIIKLRTGISWEDWYVDGTESHRCYS